MSVEYDLSHNPYFQGRDLTTRVDPLTGVLNREALEDYVNWLIANKKEFCFCMIDIDNFKNVNDTFGHLVGDLIIEQTAKKFVENSGKNAVVARYGGDEFIIVCEGLTDYQEVWEYAHNTLKTQDKKITYDCLPDISITITIGISRCPIDANTYSEILELADKVLYRGKTKGRNCFIIYLPEKHKHLNLHGERDKRMKLMQQSLAVFYGLTACGEDLSIAIRNVFKSLTLNYMFDHICLETPTRINHSVVFTLSRHKLFTHIPISEINSICGGGDYVILNDTAELVNEKFSILKEEFKKQKISSTLFCKVSAYGKDYGYIRVDTTTTKRIWQNEEVSMVIVAANTLGIILHYQKKSLDKIPPLPPIEIANND